MIKLKEQTTVIDKKRKTEMQSSTQTHVCNAALISLNSQTMTI